MIISYTSRRLNHGGRDKRIYIRHTHGKTSYHEIRIERLENIPTDEGVVDAGIFILPQGRQLVLANIHHSLCCVVSRLLSWRVGELPSKIGAERSRGGMYVPVFQPRQTVEAKIQSGEEDNFKKNKD